MFTNGQSGIKEINISGDSGKISVTNYNYRICKDSIFCKKYSDKLLKRIADTLKTKGIIYDYICDGDCGGVFNEDTLLISIYNEGFHTNLFNYVICSRGIYFSTMQNNQYSEWINIKEWIFKDSIVARKASNFINYGSFVSKYFGPREWLSIYSENRIFILYGAAYSFWEEKAKYLQAIIKNTIRKD